MLKRMIPFLFLVALLMTGCSTEADTLSIDQYSWRMTSVQSKEAEGQVIAYGPGGTSTLDTAVEINLTCSAENGEFLLTDETNETTYSGTYELTDTSQESLIYEVTVGETKGMSVVAMTAYYDDKRTPTLIISLGDYSLNFFAENGA